MAEGAQVTIQKLQVYRQKSIILLLRNVARLRTKIEGDSSVMTYTGHTILQTLIR